MTGPTAPWIEPVKHVSLNKVNFVATIKHLSADVLPCYENDCQYFS